MIETCSCIFLFDNFFCFGGGGGLVYGFDIKFNVETNLWALSSTHLCYRDQNISNPLGQAESCNAQCGRILRGCLNLKVWLCCFFFLFRLFGLVLLFLFSFQVV